MTAWTVDAATIDDALARAGVKISGLVLDSNESPAAETEKINIPTGDFTPEIVNELVSAFCRDTRTEAASSSAEKFRHALLTNSTAQCIKLRSHRLGMHSGVYLSKILKLLPVLQLDLYGNVLRDVGATAVLQAASDHPTLRQLSLGANDLSVDSGVMFARELSGNRRLQALELGMDENAMFGNRFDSLVGQALGRALLANTTLKELGLNGLGLGRTSDKKEDGKFLAAASFGLTLQRNRHLQTLRLSNNALGTQGLVLILEGLRHNACLKHLDVSKNKAGPEVGLAIGQVRLRRSPPASCVVPCLPALSPPTPPLSASLLSSFDRGSD